MSAMPDPTDTPSSTEPPSPSGWDLKASRRRLLQGGLAAAPVLMTLISRPVLARQCQTPSGYVSANASTAGRAVSCIGVSPDGWKNATNRDWPEGFPRNRPFNSFFNSPPYPPFNGPPPTTLLDVLNLPATAPINDVARLIVAALLNAAAGYTPVLTTVVVKHIWEEYYTTGFGFFSPSSGAQWNHDEIIDYLLTTLS
jgi:hypothetical protein